ncbi:MAG: propionate catabolism operon regulatory protein PrpR [Alcaligenaceae bacterium]|nr:propionate catabolism operon regulatory protein PrpR [Alcaligenaceae bacterium]
MSSFPASPSTRLNIVAVGFHGLRNLLEAAAPAYTGVAEVAVLDKIYDDAVRGIAELRASRGVDAVVAAGSNGQFLRERLDVPVVLIKPDGFDLMQSLAGAAARSQRIALVTYGAPPPELLLFNERFSLQLEIRSYANEGEAQECVDTLAGMGINTVVAPGLVVDLARARGLQGLLLYSQGAVREAMSAAIDIARVARQETARREKLNIILGQLKDGVVAVGADEKIEAVNPAMEAFIGLPAEQLLGRRLSAVQGELSLAHTLRTGRAEVEQVQQVGGRTSVVTRLPILEQGRRTGAVLVCQDPVVIQRLDRSLRTRSRPAQHHAKYSLGNLVGESPALQRAKRRALRCAQSAATVLVVGESGTGKELLAQGIHNASERRAQPFVAINCAAFPESLLESELFGYVEGAFTGSSRGGKMGLFEAAHTGTIFLDEIGEMPLSLQTRLLRVLQEREVLRIGATVPTPVDLRVVAATHRDLSRQVRDGLFRQDLYYRLNILGLHLPPLRERHGDLPLLVRHLAEKIALRLNEPRLADDPLVDAVAQAGRNYAWPGNIRELENLIERIMVFREPGAEHRSMTHHELREIAPELFAAQEPPGGSELSPDGRYIVEPSQSLRLEEQSAVRPVEMDIQAVERQHLLSALEKAAGNRDKAARLLGVSRTTLWRRMKMLGV